jgi:hypothetical protein
MTNVSDISLQCEDGVFELICDLDESLNISTNNASLLYSYVLELERDFGIRINNETYFKLIENSENQIWSEHHPQ